MPVPRLSERGCTILRRAYESVHSVPSRDYDLQPYQITFISPICGHRVMMVHHPQVHAGAVKEINWDYINTVNTASTLLESLEMSRNEEKQAGFLAEAIRNNSKALFLRVLERRVDCSPERQRLLATSSRGSQLLEFSGCFEQCPPSITFSSFFPSQ